MIALRRLAYTPEDLKIIQDIVPKIWKVRGGFILGEMEKDFESAPFPDEQVFFIEIDSKPIGITGFYRFDETRLGLCWHGILSEYRRLGLGTLAFGLLKHNAILAHPRDTRIVELIPKDRKDELEPFFVDFLGFEATDQVLDHLDRPWLPIGTSWRVYEAKLI